MIYFRKLSLNGIEQTVTSVRGGFGVCCMVTSFSLPTDQDYGGNMGLEGNLQDLTTEPLYALQNTASMAGVGLAMEGQEGNEVSPPGISLS